MRRLQLCFNNQEGVIAVEAALIMLAFSMIVVAFIDFSIITGATVELSNSLRVGQQYSLGYSGNSSGIVQAIKNGSTLPANNVSATTSIVCECDGMASACNASCLGTMATFVSMTANYSVPLLFSYPGLSNPFPLSKTLVVRTQ